MGADLSQTGQVDLVPAAGAVPGLVGVAKQDSFSIPGEHDVAGAALQGLPWVGSGFNNAVAWTPTVSFATRITLFDL